MIGLQFNRWTVVDEPDENRKVLCKCICGKEKRVLKYNLKQGKSTSCGCLQKEIAAELCSKLDSSTHGFGSKKDRLYRIWNGMKSRCYSVNTHYYSNYGGRGIEVCDEWKKDFMSFREWALNNGYSDSLSIDRIDVDGNYEPNNCKWATKHEQDRNKRNNIFFNVKGEKLTMKEVSRLTGIPDNTLHYRYHVHGKKTYEEIIQPIKRGSDTTC
jgi:hypothetical protein